MANDLERWLADESNCWRAAIPGWCARRWTRRHPVASPPRRSAVLLPLPAASAVASSRLNRDLAAVTSERNARTLTADREQDTRRASMILCQY